MKSYNLYIIFLMLLCPLSGISQDLKNVLKQKPVTYGAGIQLGSYFSAIKGRSQITSPFGYYINANANISIYGFKFPFSVTFRDQQLNYTQPMFRLGMSPSYKWARFYIGHGQMMFSNYTLAGMIFNGGGISLTPGKLRFSAMAGTMESPRAILDSISGSRNYIQPYKRLGIGAKVGIGTASNYIDLMIFNGKDKKLAIDIPDSVFINPVENTVLGLQSSLSLFKNILQFHWNVGASIYTNNKNADPLEADAESGKYLVWGEAIMAVNTSTRLNLAGDAMMKMQLGNYHVGARYQYIDPGYTSMGAYYFKDDNENYTLDAGMSLFNGKLSVDGSFGLQRNNISGHRSLGTLQKIYDASVNLNASSYFGLNAQYSNFNFNQVSGLVQINDSLRFGQINSNTSFSPYINFGSKSIKQSISLNYSNQLIKDLSFEQFLGEDDKVKSANISYTISNKPKAYSVNTSLQYLQNDYSGVNSERTGIYISGQKRWFENKFQTRLQINFSKNTTERIADGNQYGGNAGINWKIGKANSLNLQLNYIDRNAVSGRSYSEWRGSTSLNFQLK